MRGFISKSILIFVMGLLILPHISFAQSSPEELIKKQGNLELKKQDSELILKEIVQELSDTWINLPKPEEQVILILLRKGVRIHALEYLLLDLGGEAIKSTLELAYLLLVQDPGLFIKKFEDYTVDKAKEYAMEWLLQKEIKVGKGNLGFSYRTNNSSWEQGVFPYIIIYKPLDPKNGEVMIGIYSSRTIKTPELSWSYQWEGGIDELPPFIVEIKGEVNKSGKIYTWTKGPEIEIIFDRPVPRFEFKKPTIGDRFTSALGKFKLVIGKIKEISGEVVESIINGAEFIWDKTTSLFFSSKTESFTASVVDLLPSEEQEVIDNNIQSTEQSLGESPINYEESSVMTEPIQSKVNKEDIQEMIDDIEERIDILIEEVNRLTKQEAEEVIELEEAIESEKIEDYEITIELEETEPEIELVAEIGDRVISRVIRRGSGGGGDSPPPPSYCSLPESNNPSRDKVIFNEIAWMGTETSSDDEWIELKNLSEVQVDLFGWQIIDKDQQIKVILNSESTISVNDFYLLERTNDDSVLNIVADNIYTGALNNSNEAVYLFDNDCSLQDIVMADPGWLAGNNEEKRSMERNKDLDWYTYSGEGENGIMGTPMLENSIESVIEVVSESDGAVFNDEEQESEETELDSEDTLPEDVLEIESGTVIFNEIAWMGTKASANDEWIELYNTSSESVEILDWQMIFYPLAGNPRITTFSLLETETPAISGSSYFLLERTNDTSVNNIEADYIFTGALNDNGGIIELRDSNNNLIDRVDASNGWPSGNKDKRISMERITSTDDWADNNIIIYNGKDIEDNNIFGTPKAKNSVNQLAEISRSRKLPFDEFDEITLGIQSSPYIIRTDLNVPENKILNINPGVILKFYNDYGISMLTIDGTLKAIGEETNKIIFTSIRDDEYGGDTNDDGDNSSPASGSWGQIYFTDKSVDSELSNVVVRYGGDVPIFAGTTGCAPELGGIRVEQSFVTIKNSTIEQNKRRGIYLTDSSSIIDNVQLLNNPVCCLTCHNQFGGYGIEVRGGDPVIKNSLFRENVVGINVDENIEMAFPSIENNIFEKNGTAIRISKALPYLSENQAINNDINGVLVIDHIYQNTTWLADLPYVIRSSVSILSEVTLTLEPGVVVKFYDRISSLIVDGTLKANDVVFTSFRDDEYGGDTNNDGTDSFPRPSDWNKIKFTSSSIDSELNNVIVRYGGGGQGTPCSGEMTGIEVDQSSIVLKDSIIEYNQYRGLRLINSSSVINSSQFSNNPACYNQYGSIGIAIEKGTPTISNSLIKQNKWGIYIRDEGKPILNNLSFGVGDEANTCNIFKHQECINPLPEPDPDPDPDPD